MVDHFTLLGSVITLIVVPITAMLIWLFKFVFEKSVPQQYERHSKELDAIHNFWRTELQEERKVFREAIETISSDLKEFQFTMAQNLKNVNETLVNHQKQIESLLALSFLKKNVLDDDDEQT